MVYIGTSGFSYDDWVGPYYPAELPRRGWLEYYAQEFNTVEINSTYYAIPSVRTTAALARRVPAGFLFAVKLPRELTHERTTDGAEVFRQFRVALDPIIAAGKLGALLAQFPNSFRPDPKAWDHIARLRELAADLPLVVEFRHAGWVCPETFGRLRRLGVGFCCVDEPQLPGLLPPVAEATGPVGYVRFHGRNKAKWWKHEHAYERYDYTYSVEELAEWVPKIRHIAGLTERIFVFANNHFQAQAIQTARQLRMLLEEPAFPC